MSYVSYEEQVLGLVVNAGKVDLAEWKGSPPQEEDSTPFPVQQLSQFDFRLRPTNFNASLLVESDKRERCLTFFDWESVCRWYRGSNLVNDVDKKAFLLQRLPFNPYDQEKHLVEPVLRHLHTFRLDDETPLHKLKKNGISLRPVWVEADGSCLVHSASVALTGTQLYSEALRYKIYEELRDHPDFYLNVGIVRGQDRERFGPRLEAEAEKASELGLKDRAASMRQARDELLAYSNTRPQWSAAVYEQALEKARPAEGEILTQDRYLEEIHIAALANVLRRPIIILGEQFQGGIFCPFRHNPEGCKVPGTDHANPPLVIFEQYEHYVPLCLQRKEDYWSWAREMFPGDHKAMEALELYEMERGGSAHRIPEWLEEITMYAAGAGAVRLDEILRLQDVEHSVAEECKRAFGSPREMQALPIAFAISDEPVLCHKTLRNEKAMNAIFEAMGFEVIHSVDRTGGVVQLRYLLTELDLEKIHKLTWCLYVQMEQVYPVPTLSSPTLTPTPGILPCEGDADKDLWLFVLNMTQREEVNIGMARLYCDPIGWDFGTMALNDQRDPTAFVAGEMERLKGRFCQITGKNFDSTVSEDLHHQKWTVRSGDLRRQMPKALPMMQTVIRSRPYPGRERNLLPGRVALVDYRMDSSPTSPRATILVSEVPVSTIRQRQHLLDSLKDCYGLPENEGYEKLAASVFLFQQHSEERTRLLAGDWVAQSEGRMPQTISRQRCGPYNLDTVMVGPCNPDTATIIEEVHMTEAHPVVAPADDEEEEEKGVGRHEEAKQGEDEVVADLALSSRGEGVDLDAALGGGDMEVSPQVSPPGSPPLRLVGSEELAPVMSPSRKPRDSGSSSGTNWAVRERGLDAASSDGSDSEGVVLVDGSEDVEEPFSMREVHLRG